MRLEGATRERGRKLRRLEVKEGKRKCSKGKG